MAYTEAERSNFYRTLGYVPPETTIAAPVSAPPPTPPTVPTPKATPKATPAQNDIIDYYYRTLGYIPPEANRSVADVFADATGGNKLSTAPQADQDYWNSYSDPSTLHSAITNAVNPENQKMWDDQGNYIYPTPKPTPTPTPVPTLSDVTPYVSPETPTYDLEQPGSIAAPYVAPEPYVPDPAQLASGQMDMLMNQNGAYLQQAAKAGERTAQARGLLNSSMAAGAAQGAAMDRAQPLALANAEVYAAAGMTGYEGEIQAALTNLQGQIQSNLSYQDSIQSDYINQRSLVLQGLISSGLSTQEAEQNLQAFEYQNLLNTGLSDRQAQDKIDQIQLQAANDLVLDQQQQYGANYRTELERDLNLDKLDAADRDAVSTAMTNYGLQFQKDVLNIQMDAQTSGAEKEAKILTAQTVYENNLNNVAALYQVDLTWETPFDLTTTSDTTTNTDTTSDVVTNDSGITVPNDSIATPTPGESSDLYYSNGVKKPPAILGQNDFVFGDGSRRPGVTDEQVLAHAEDVRKANEGIITGN